MNDRNHRVLWLLGLVAALGFVAAGCRPECSNDSDCATKGMGYTCQSNKCVAPSATDSGQTDAGQPMNDAGPTPDAGPQDGGVDAGPLTALALSTLADAGFTSPMGTALSSDGQTAYFTAFDPSGNAGVWKVTAASAPVAVSSGAPFVMPSGLCISGDDATLYVADIGSTGTLTDGGASDLGGLWSLPAAGASPAPIRSDVTQPVAVTLAADGTSLLVSARSGVYRMASGGGSATALTPTGVGDPGEASEIGGALWVADHRAASGYGALLRYVGGVGTDLTPATFQYGFPAGLAGSVDGSTVYAAFQGGLWYVPSTGVGQGARVNLTGGAVDLPSGLSRAKSGNTFAFANGEGSNGQIEVGR